MSKINSFSVATWNVNSLRMRQNRLLSWLEHHQPDVICLQETKLENSLFPSLEFLQAGYRSVFVGQKSYNGVAILSKQEHGTPENIMDSLHDNEDDKEARFIAATIPGLQVRVFSIYVPQGQVVGSEKYLYKLKWLKRLRNHLDTQHQKTQPLILGGDFNVAPEDKDVYDKEQWKDTVICHSQVRAALHDVLNFGLFDTLRLKTQEPKIYTYWDYRQLALAKNFGLRIDHILITEPLKNRCLEVKVDKEARKGDQPSDHAPYLVSFSI